MGERTYISSGFDLTEEDWVSLPKTKKRNLISIRELIITGFDKVKDEIKSMIHGEGFSSEGLKKRLERGRKTSIIGAFEKKIENLEKSGQVGTSITYKCARNSIRKYLGTDVNFSDITIDWLKKYEAYMLNSDKSRTTIKMYVECIRSLMNDARSERIITDGQYPFGRGKFEIKKGTGRKLALSLAQIKAVMQYPLLTENDKRMRDLWFFSYLTNGINFSDLLRLKYKDITSGEIHFIRKKTIRTAKVQKEIIAPLIPQMQTIIEKWGNPEMKSDNYIFPFLHKGMTPSEEKMEIQNVVRLCNKKMAKISHALSLPPISTYTARHSFATVLKRSGANIAFISESLGHTDIRTTENYLASFEQEERRKNASLLYDFENRSE